MKSKIAISVQFTKWSELYERKNYPIIAAKKKDASEKAAASRSHFTGFVDRALQALWQTWMQVCQIAWAWPEILSIGQQAQTKADNGLRSFGLPGTSQPILGKFSTGESYFGRALRDQSRVVETAGKALARPPPCLRWSLLMATVCFDIDELAILIANMLENAVRSGELESTEVGHEQQDSEKSSSETGIHLSAPVEHDTGLSQPGEYGAAICPEGQRHRTEMAEGDDPHTGWGPGSIRDTIDSTQGFPTFGCPGVDEECGSDLLPGSLPTVAFLHGLAPLAGALRFHGYVDHRRGWMLQALGFQRSIIVGLEGNHVSGGASFPARAPPGRQVEQSEKRGTQNTSARGLCLR